MKRLRWAVALVILIGGAAALVIASQQLAPVRAEAAGPASAPAAKATPTDTAASCLKCHEMQAQVNTWHNSSHNTIDCLACHADPGVQGWWQVNLSSLRWRIAHWRGGVTGMNISTAVPDDRCLRCHGDQMPYVMEDYAPPAIDGNGNVGRLETAQLTKLLVQPRHDLHLTQVPGVTCTTCHAQVGHGVASQEAVAEASHTTCNTCHSERQVNLAGNSSLTCTACHTDAKTVTPASHSLAWRQGHGEAARQDSAGCATCHLSQDLAKAGATLGPAVQPASQPTAQQAVRASWLQPAAATETPEDACQGCHQVPMPHPASFLADHGKAYSADPAVCARCHLTEDQGFNLTPTQNPASLPATPACRDCHTSRNPHPASQSVANPAALAPVRVTSHPAALPDSPNCQTCHAGRGNVCATCHKGTAWHPADWVSTHRNTVWEQGDKACRTCHNTPDACSRCHSETGPVLPQS